MKRHIALYLALSALLLAGVASAAESKIKKDKLQIVFLFGQSNMVGLANPMTAWYLTQPAYVPPRDVAIGKPEVLDWDSLYWQGIKTFEGPQELKDQLAALYQERRDSRTKWRRRANELDGPWQEDQWGPKPKGGRGNMYPFLDQKADEEGIHARMAKILDSPLNKFPQEKAYQEIISRDKMNAAHIQRVREIYLKGTKGEDFDAFEAALKEAKLPKQPTSEVEALRAKYAALAKQYVHLPIAERTYISGFGAIAGSEGEGIQSITQGPLSIGYGGGLTTIGPEYGVGITLERLVDAPVLLVKCSWGNTTVNDAWRPESLDGVETPTEKAVREAWNQAETENAKKEGREPRLRKAREKLGRPGWCWTLALPHVKKVLAEPGKYHPEYDPEKGYDIAGMVWFQGYSDQQNPAYGEQLAEMIKWFRQQVDAPQMPVVCGSVGVGSYQHTALTGNVNGGMVEAAQSPGLKGTVDVVNTGRYFPLELDFVNTVLKGMKKDTPAYEEMRKLQSRTISNQGFHYHGSAKFFLLAGDAMGRSLANLITGGEPSILNQVAE